ncbi:MULTISPECIES: VOC family protein [Streptomyces]|uniref:VOC family protein n=1 Tax=Streptomyces maoxianensis TaxID=1459942 RepID=A0ABV9G7U8_9ACTN|nr:VOC family protein [Streptomyces sp. ISL-1]MBT2391063.1 VOC family protein [Streptomyces sp. ISL-1]
MPIDLFAGIYVSDYEAAKAWYVRVLGSEPAFLPSDTEAVWELAEHRYLYIQQNAEHAGHAVQTILVDDLDARVDRIADRGIEPVKRETYPNGMRKVLYRDPDGNEIGYGGAPL